ncbi:MAG: NYN domain-containing protein [Nitrospirota bacterium]|nr:NYN domain-containing protein [Nitrospirota bacterium]
MGKVVFMIDGWFMRKRIYNLKSFHYDGPNIRKYCCSHLKKEDQLYRIFYYDTEPLDRKGHNPVSKKFIDFKKTPVAEAQYKLLESIKRTPNFALRLGRTVWKNNSWVLNHEKFNSLISKKITVDDITEKDVRPLIEQKTVDMKIGLDIASIATKRLADTLIIITGDADIVPALKLARQEGMMVGLDPLWNPIQPELSEHVDFVASKTNKHQKESCNEGNSSPQ